MVERKYTALELDDFEINSNMKVLHQVTKHVAQVLFCLLILASTKLSAQVFLKKFDEFEKVRINVAGDDFFVEAEVIVPEKERFIKPGDTRTYSWSSGNEIRSTQGGYAGRLLHGVYVSTYLNKGIKEKGTYKYGLKDKVWRQWTEDGFLSSIYTWKKGYKDGLYILYGDNGTIREMGHYKEDKLNGPIKKYNSTGNESVQVYHNGIPKVKTTPLAPFQRKEDIKNRSTDNKSLPKSSTKTITPDNKSEHRTKPEKKPKTSDKPKEVKTKSSTSNKTKKDHSIKK
jgi:hypothetical protein